MKRALPIALATLCLSGCHPALAQDGVPRLTFRRAFHPDPARVRVVDGDTLVYRDTHYRLIGLDTPELHIPCEHDRAVAAKTRLQELLREPSHRVLIREARRRDKFGRVLAVVLSNGKDVAPILIGQGLAHPYNGVGTRPGWGC